jgi:hypothetical protein
MTGPCSASAFASQIGKPNALQSMSNVLPTDPHRTVAALTPAQRGAAADKGQQVAASQAPGVRKRCRSPETSLKAFNKKKKGSTEGDQEDKQAQAIGREIKQLMQVINNMMQVCSCFVGQLGCACIVHCALFPEECGQAHACAYIAG